MKIIVQKFLTMSLLLALTGCSSNIKDTLGVGAAAPNEFTVIAHQRLSIPQEFSLPEPQSELSFAERAEDKRFAVPEQISMNNTDKKFLHVLGIEQGIDINAQRQIDVEYRQTKEKSQESGLLKKKSKQPLDKLVDAPSEKKRLQALLAAGGKVNDSRAKLTERSESFFNGLLGN
jgi:hypothetical protein